MTDFNQLPAILGSFSSNFSCMFLQRKVCGWGGDVTGQEGFRERGVVGGPKGLQPSGTSIHRRMVLELATQMTCI